MFLSINAAIALAYSVGRYWFNQQSIRSGQLVVELLDPMPSWGEFRRQYSASGKGLRFHLRGHRLLQTLAMATLGFGMAGAFLWFSPLAGLLVGLVVLVEILVPCYQWISVDLGLMRRSWSWLVRSTGDPRYFDY